MKLFRTGPNGDEAILHVCGPGDTFGEAAMFVSGRYPVSAAAIEPASLVSLPAEGIRAAIREAPEIAFGMLASVSRHLHQLVDQLEAMKRLTGDQRVAMLLVSLADVESGPATVTLPQEKAVIAGRLGITPESFSRALTRLRADGVEVEGAKLRIRDVALLRERAE